MTDGISGRAVALVPVKRLELAKSRLAPLLSSAARRHLQEAMLAHVLGELASAPGLDGAAVVTSDIDAASIADRFAARLVPDTSDELNAALSAAISCLVADGAAVVVIVPADLPELTAADVGRAVAEVRRTGATLVVPDAEARGTNGLVFPARSLPNLSFGPGSFHRHLAEPGARPFPLPSFARDLDRPDDLAALRPALSCLEALS